MRVIYPQQVPLLAAATAASLLAIFVITASASSQTASPTTTPLPTPTANPATRSPTLSPPPTPSPFSNISPSELAGQRAKWNSQAITSYTYVLEMICFCPVSPPTYRSAYIVTVRDSVTESVTDLAGQPVSADFPVVKGLTTVDALFAEVERLLAGPYYLAEVTYDPTWGFPARIKSDGSWDVVDDERTVVIRDFEVLPVSLPPTGGRR